MLKFYFAPGSCSVGIRALLEEAGVEYEPVLVNLGAGEQRSTSYEQINPKRKVPVLILDSGETLTEFPAIAWWVGSNFPELELLPGTPSDQVRCLSSLCYITGTVHPSGFTRIFRPEYFSVNPDEKEPIQALGRTAAERGLAVLSDQLSDNDYLLYKRSIADYAILFVARWTIYRTDIELPPNLHRHYERMVARDAVQRAFKADGLSL